MKRILFALLAVAGMVSCTENKSNGERIGLVTQFSRSGVIWKSWEGHLNLTQTGMNSSIPFDFSIDNDNEPAGIAAVIDSAATYGWKVKLKYHQTFGKNWLKNRGSTNHFVTSCEVLDRQPVQNALSGGARGHVIDTVYLVIWKDVLKEEASAPNYTQRGGVIIVDSTTRRKVGYQSREFQYP